MKQLMLLSAMACGLCAMAQKPNATGWSVGELNGAPGLFHDGKPVAPMLFWQWEIKEQDVRAMSKVGGISLFGVFGSSLHYAHPYWKPEGYAGIGYQDKNLDEVLNWVPDAAFLPRLFYTAPDWWIKAHPEEQVAFSNPIARKVPRESFASERLRRECAPFYRQAVRHLMDRYGEHLMGIHLASGPWGEHFAWDALRQGDATPVGEAGHGDVSAPMTRRFRDYLRTKYHGDVSRLKAAWRNASVTFENAEVPSMAARLALDETGVWRDPAKGRAVPDYLECMNLVTVEMLDHFARIVKDESGGTLPTLAFYGYTQDEHWAIECDHRGTAAAYRSPCLDMFSAPHTYNRRMPGEDGAMRCYLAPHLPGRGRASLHRLGRRRPFRELRLGDAPRPREGRLRSAAAAQGQARP